MCDVVMLFSVGTISIAFKSTITGKLHAHMLDEFTNESTTGAVVLQGHRNDHQLCPAVQRLSTNGTFNDFYVKYGFQSTQQCGILRDSIRLQGGSCWAYMGEKHWSTGDKPRKRMVAIIRGKSTLDTGSVPGDRLVCERILKFH